MGMKTKGKFDNSTGRNLIIVEDGSICSGRCQKPFKDGQTAYICDLDKLVRCRRCIVKEGCDTDIAISMQVYKHEDRRGNIAFQKQ